MPRPRRSHLAFRSAVTMLLLAVLAACTGRLDPPRVAEPTPACRTDDATCLADGRAAFETYRQEKVAAIYATTHGLRLPGAPEVLLHDRRTEYVALLVHGLNDSAYYMRDIARVLHARGFNTLSLLLPGHADHPEAMRDVTAEQWRAEVARGLRMASLLGRRIVIGGFSLGAMLSIDALLNGAAVDGLFLFSPPFAFRSDLFQVFGSLTCLPGIRSIIVETDLPPNPVKYRNRTANGACQTYRVVGNVIALANEGRSVADPHLEKIARIGTRIRVPTFVAMTYEDARVSPEAVWAFTRAIPAPVTLATFGPPPAGAPAAEDFAGRLVHITDAPLAHSFLTLRDNPYNGQANPNFADLETLLIEHLGNHFGERG